MHEMMFVCEKGETEIWLCLDCGRQIEITWTPFSYKVVEPGEEEKAHSGSKNGLKVDVNIK